MRRASPLAQAADVELRLVPGTSSATVEADPDRIVQVLLILVDNAIKYTPAGGRVRVEVGRDNGCGVLRVVDTGTGIAPEHLPRIFDRFYRVDTARSRERGGTGLGLAIARMLVTAHGGQLSLTSTVGAGTQAHGAAAIGRSRRRALADDWASSRRRSRTAASRAAEQPVEQRITRVGLTTSPSALRRR